MRQSASVIRVGYVSRNLKQILAWIIDKWLRIISNILLIKTDIPLKNKAIFSLNQY